MAQECRLGLKQEFGCQLSANAGEHLAVCFTGLSVMLQGLDEFPAAGGVESPLEAVVQLLAQLPELSLGKSFGMMGGEEEA